ncbi:MAG: hypothetical protein KDB82_00940 [Planctomycetes bacterium]|nr:hypothetical protein [Planctomycetota bacterium]
MIENEALEYDDNHLWTLDGVPFSGFAFEIDEESGWRTETEYKNGLEDGTSLTFDTEGVLRERAEYYRGALHGSRRRWNGSGELVSETIAEYGYLVTRRRLGDDGTMQVVYSIQSNPSQLELLELARRRHEEDA